MSWLTFFLNDENRDANVQQVIENSDVIRFYKSFKVVVTAQTERDGQETVTIKLFDSSSLLLAIKLVDVKEYPMYKDLVTFCETTEDGYFDIKRFVKIIDFRTASVLNETASASLINVLSRLLFMYFEAWLIEEELILSLPLEVKNAIQNEPYVLQELEFRGNRYWKIHDPTDIFN